MSDDWQTLTDLVGDRPFVVTKIRLADSAVTIGGEFELPPLAGLRYEDQVFVSEFVRSHGSIKQMEKAFGISYPTVKNRLNRIVEQLRLLKLDDREIDDVTMQPAALGALIKLVKSGTISNTIAKTVFEEMYKTGRDADSIVKEKGLMQISDTSAILTAIEKVLAENPAQVADYRGGKDKLFGFFVGQVMKLMAGRANPAVVNDLLKEKLKGN